MALRPTLSTPVALAGHAAALVLFVVMLSGLRWGDWAQEMAFYGAYHQDPVNQAIHFVGVPSLLASAFVLLAYLRLPLVGISWASVVAAVYVGYYAYMDGGSLGAQLFIGVLVIFLWLATRAVAADVVKTDKGLRYRGRAAAVAALIQVLSWAMQVGPGHAYFEQVKPALLDSLGQSFSVAPLFAFYEGVFALGLQDELAKRVATLVAQKRAEMCLSSAAYAFCT